MGPHKKQDNLSTIPMVSRRLPRICGRSSGFSCINSDTLAAAKLRKVKYGYSHGK
jgi:hypothetical protein